VFRIPVLVYMGLIFYVSSGPIESPLILKVPDYYLHASAYAALCVLLFWAVHEGLVAQPGRGGQWLPLLITGLYGATDELHQSFVPGRDASVADLAADVAGGLIALVLILSCRRLISLFRARNAS
jgi:VanZ family protein